MYEPVFSGCQIISEKGFGFLSLNLETGNSILFFEKVETACGMSKSETGLKPVSTKEYKNENPNLQDPAKPE